MEKELRAEDLFATVTHEPDLKINPEYEVEIKLSSCGKLGLPAVLHAKDYSFDDTLLFAKATQQNESAIVLKLIKNLVYEDIDISKITRQDAVEILMAIQGTFYTNYIDGKQYYIDESLEGDALTDKENISTATIPINDIQTIPIKDNITVPIKISNNKLEALFDYPRLIHDTRAKEYVINKFAKQDNEYSSLMQARAKKEATREQLKTLKDYETEKNLEYVRVITSQQIISYNGETPKNIDEQLLLMKKMPVSVLTLLANILKVNFNFGVQPEVTFIDNETQEKITRRFNFRYSDFIPSMESGNASEFNVSFG